MLVAALPAIELSHVDSPRSVGAPWIFPFWWFHDRPRRSVVEGRRRRNHGSRDNLKRPPIRRARIIVMNSPVQGLPVRKSSCKWTLHLRLSTLVKSPMKFNVRSNFCSDSHPPRFSIFSTLFIAKFRYSSFFNLARFSGWLRREKRERVNAEVELNYYQFSGSSWTAGGGFSAHGTNPERSQSARYSPDAARAPRGWKRATRCAPTFSGWAAR